MIYPTKCPKCGESKAEIQNYPDSSIEYCCGSEWYIHGQIVDQSSTCKRICRLEKRIVKMKDEMKRKGAGNG